MSVQRSTRQLSEGLVDGVVVGGGGGGGGCVCVYVWEGGCVCQYVPVQYKSSWAQMFRLGPDHNYINSVNLT